MRRRTASLLALGLAAGLLLPAQAQSILEDTLLAPAPEAIAGFGYAVAAAEGTDEILRVLVTAPGENPEGAAYVFAHDETTREWVIESTLHPPGLAPNYGHVAALLSSAAGDLAAVSDVISQPANSSRGRVYLYRQSTGGTWVEETVLELKPITLQNGFGSGLAVAALPSAEEVVFVGARNDGDDGGDVREGSAYAFTRAPGADEWVREVRLLAGDGQEGDRFGEAVALLPTPGLPGGHAGDALALVGAPQHDHPTPFDGAAYAFTRDGQTGAWTLETEILVPDVPPGNNGALFGSTVGLLPLPGGAPGEGLAVVGAPVSQQVCTGLVNAGAAYVFRREADGEGGFTWVQETVLCPSEPRANSYLGSALALAPGPASPGGDPLTVRALLGTDPRSFEEGHPGAADLFERDPETGAWSLAAHFESGESGFSSDWFGHAVALTGAGGAARAYVGAYLNDTGVENGGAVFVYDTAGTVANEPVPQDVPEAGGVALSVRPNPVRDRAEVAVRLTAPASVRVSAYDVLRREVAVLHDGPLGAGTHTLALEASALAPGVYVVAVDAEAGRAVRAFTVVR